MKRVILLCTALLFLGTVGFAQEAVKDTTWKTGGLISATFGQVSLTNWAAGGLSSISGNGHINLFANHQKGKGSWDNNLILAYGLLKQGEADVVKSDDRIEFTTKYGREAWSPDWSYTALANFRTQFTEGLDAEGNRISDLMAPGYLLASLGFDYRPNDNFSFYISPVTGKFTFVTDEILAAQGAYGVEAGVLGVDDSGNLVVIQDGKTSRSELGGYIRTTYNKNLMENVNFLTSLDLFSNYDNPTLLDVNWDTMISLKVNEYITTSLGLTVIYDHDIKIQDGDKIGPRTQFRQIFGVGFAYTL